MNWFAKARLGMFVHWGHSSVRGWELSWPLVGGVFSLPYCQNVAIATYHQNAENFNPTAYNPQQWATLAKSLGVQYVILTTKHHDGFTLFPTATSDFSYVRGERPDLVKQFVEAMREAGLKVGFYFSLIDWHHPDYPAFTEADKPYRFDKLPRPTPQQWERFLEIMFEQIRELLTNYGRIDVIWFDGSWERSPEQWRAEELGQMIRQLQPEILINDRLPGQRDFATPEQFVPPQPPSRLLPCLHRRPKFKPTKRCFASRWLYQNLLRPHDLELKQQDLVCSKLIFHIFGALAEFERNLIRERTQAGLKAARARRRKGGRPKTLEPTKRQLAVKGT